jgi:hypothetical protein
VPDGFHGDETLLTSYETLAFSFLTLSAKLMIFNAMKLSVKFPGWPNKTKNLDFIVPLRRGRASQLKSEHALWWRTVLQLAMFPSSQIKATTNQRNLQKMRLSVATKKTFHWPGPCLVALCKVFEKTSFCI